MKLFVCDLEACENCLCPDREIMVYPFFDRHISGNKKLRGLTTGTLAEVFRVEFIKVPVDFLVELYIESLEENYSIQEEANGFIRIEITWEDSAHGSYYFLNIENELRELNFKAERFQVGETVQMKNRNFYNPTAKKSKLFF